MEGETGLLPTDRLLVCNMLGQALLVRACYDSPNVQMDISALPAGTYLLVILRNDKTLARERFVVTK